MFIDRTDAGIQLAGVLDKYRDNTKAVVMAIPRGGVVTGFIVARELHLPLDVLMVKKLGHPRSQEFAIGAVSLKGRVLDKHSDVSHEYIEEETQNIRELLKKQYEMYLGNKSPIDMRNKIVIVVDDGMATGKTLMASLELVKTENPKKVIVAVPVGPAGTIARIKSHGYEVVCLESHDDFWAIGLHYKDFSEVTDKEVQSLLTEATKISLS